MAKQIPISQKNLEEKIAKARATAAAKRAAFPYAIKASYDAPSNEITVFLSNGTRFSFPAQLGQGLSEATPEQLREVEVTPSGTGLHWAALDADLSIPHLIHGIFGTESWMSEIGKKGGASTSQSKAEAARQNGKKGGRPPKKLAAV